LQAKRLTNKLDGTLWHITFLGKQLVPSGLLEFSLVSSSGESQDSSHNILTKSKVIQLGNRRSHRFKTIASVAKPSNWPKDTHLNKSTYNTVSKEHQVLGLSWVTE